MSVNFNEFQEFCMTILEEPVFSKISIGHLSNFLRSAATLEVDKKAMRDWNVDDASRSVNYFKKKYSEIPESYGMPNKKDLTPKQVFAIHALAGESGEAIEKIIYNDNLEEAKPKIAKELADVMWSILVIAKTLGYSADDIANIGREKWQSRINRGTLHGSGDDR